LEQFRPFINGLIHCTGGGQTKVGKFVQGKKIIKDNLLPVPPMFQLIQAESGATWKEMYQVFNMGQRLEVYVPVEQADAIVSLAQSFNIDAAIIGRVEEAPENLIHISSPYGIFEYA
jgi:phosphoribosylformylglycinamidine cyclo-ligase